MYELIKGAIKIVFYFHFYVFIENVFSYKVFLS